MTRIGVVGTHGKWSSEKLADTVEEITGFRLLIDMEKISFNFSDAVIMYQDIDLFSLDALIIKKVGTWYSPDLLDRLEGLRFMNEKGMPFFSKPINILRVLDRLSCTVTLQIAGIPMPETTMTESIELAENAVQTYGEAVFKPLYSTKAKGMIVIKDGPEALKQITAFKKNNPIMYIQKKIDHQGKDLGITFLGGNYLTTYARCSDGTSWNTTTRSGGRYEAYTPDDKTIALAQKAQNLFGLDFTCVDVALTPEGPMVFEVSAFGGFRGIQTASGIDASRQLVDYVLKEIKS